MRSRKAAARSNSKFLAASRICDSSWAIAVASSCSVVISPMTTSSSGHGNVIGFDDSGELHIHGFDDGMRRDVVLAIVGFLFRAAAICFADGLAHGVGHYVSVQNGASFQVARATADRLD